MISSRHTEDPRLEALFNLDEVASPDVRPMVKRPGSGVPGWAFAVAALVAAILLFQLLESRRQQPAAPAVRPGAVDTAAGSYEPPPLYIPPAYPIVAEPVLVSPPAPITAPINPMAVVPQARPMPVPSPAPRSPPATVMYPAPLTAEAPPPVRPRVSAGPVLVADVSESGSSAAGARQDQAGSTGGLRTALAGRVRAGAFANPSGTVPQGALIPAVLETAFDSTKAGFARALVSRDVRSFDGSRVLIPRGSRLIGEYGAEVAPAQKRAAIIWSRLIRPDGLTVELASPAVDPLGRAGVPASVNTHFFQRFTGALLRTTMDIGSALASRASRAPVLVAVPGTVSSQVSGATSSTIVPTLRVPAGRSISVFVAQDLDFGSQERSR